MLPHMAEGGLGVLIDNSTVWTKGQLLVLLPMLIDCLTRHSCQRKFVRRNSQSVPTRISGGTMAVKLGGPVFIKADKATGRCFHRLSGVYKGTQSTIAVERSRNP